MRRYFLLLISLLLWLTQSAAGPAMKWNQAYQDYFNRYKDLAIQEMLKYGIPASITLAQGVLESGAGRSDLSVRGNNHFGIKCHGWTGRTMTHDDDERGECFRAYDTVQESFEDHSLFLRGRQRYSSLFSLSRTDYRGWAHGLKRAGYATNPHYAQRLIDIIELYKLYQYDTAKDYDRFMAEHNGSGSVSVPESTAPRVDMSLHQIHEYNENYYIEVRRGDTFKSLAKELGVSRRKLAKYNERGKNDQLHAGERIWLKKKQKRAPRNFKNRPHRVRSRESLYDIAQKYGVRLKSIVRKNRKIAERGLRLGDEVRIY